MLQIRRAQFDALRRGRRQAFITEMTAHSRVRFPHITTPLADDQLRLIVEQRVTDALDAGFRLRGLVRLQLEIGFILGVGYATDPQYPWAGEILGLPDVVTDQRRARKLYEAAQAYFATVHGPGRRYAKHALQDLEYVAKAGLTEFPVDGLEDTFIRLVRSVYPQKARETGRTAMQRLFEHACEEGSRHGLEKPRDRLLVAALMLAFGHKCFHDRAQPWIAASVTDPSESCEERGARLERRALTRLKAVNHGSNAPT